MSSGGSEKQEQEDLEQDQVLWCEVDNPNLCHHCLNPKRIVGWVTKVWWKKEREEEKQAPVLEEAGHLVRV